MNDFSGKTVLITGGGSGIGRATAIAFARRGARAIVAGRRAPSLAETVAQIELAGGVAEAIAADISKAEEVDRLHDAIFSRYGRLDAAFDNAGYQEPRAPLVEQDPALFDRVMDTNLRGVWLCLRRQIAHMKEHGGGSIVINASVSGQRNANPGLALYSASKAAVLSLMRAAAMEYAEAGVRINAVSPGRVITDMMLNSRIMDMKAVAAGLPIRRMGQPEEVAEAVVWLASPAASFVVGHTLCADGGFMAS